MTGILILAGMLAFIATTALSVKIYFSADWMWYIAKREYYRIMGRVGDRFEESVL